MTDPVNDSVTARPPKTHETPDRLPLRPQRRVPRLLARLLLCLVLVAAVGAVYHDLPNHGFLNWDDNRYIEDNYLIRDFSPGGLARLWTQFHFTDYLPVNLTSYALDYRL